MAEPAPSVDRQICWCRGRARGYAARRRDTRLRPAGGAAQVDFRVLGPVEVVAEETRGVPGGAIPRAILALLLVAGAPVGRDRLIDELWGMDPPKTAVNALHVHLSALRRLCADRLRTTPAGYLLEPTADDSIDLVDFESALRAGT